LETEVSQEREFYVGYADSAPFGLRRFRRKAVSILSAGAGGVAIALAVSLQPFVPSVFEFLNVRTLQGVIEEAPYPSLLVERPGGPGAGYSRYFLVAPGKSDAASEVAGMDGKSVTAEGTLIYLNGQTLVELRPGSVSVDATAGHVERPVAETIGEVTLEGEIVDSKCYLGVMNPGRGKVHKDCAIRCISGGVPPALLVTDAGGNSLAIILAGADGKPLGQSILGLVGEPVRVTGRLENSADALVLYGEPSRNDFTGRGLADPR
jgi:hypothetical protein